MASEHDFFKLVPKLTLFKIVSNALYLNLSIHHRLQFDDNFGALLEHKIIQKSRFEQEEKLVRYPCF